MKRLLKETIAIWLLPKLILSILLLIPSIFILFVTGMSEYQCINKIIKIYKGACNYIDLNI